MIRAKKNNSNTLKLSVKDQELRRKILIWQSLQQLYMPYATVIRSKSQEKKEKDRRKEVPAHVSSQQRDPSMPASSDLRLPGDVEKTESAVDMDLLLPSSFPGHVRSGANLVPLAVKEQRLRHAQCREALTSLRRRLRVCARLFDNKRLHTAGTGTRPNTRMQALLDRQAIHRDRDVERYRAARNALASLDPDGPWQNTLRPLLNQDIRAPIRGQVETMKITKKRKSRQGADLESEGRRTLSWLWLSTPQIDGTSDEAAKHELEEGMVGTTITNIISDFAIENRIAHRMGKSFSPRRTMGRRGITPS